MNGETDDQMFDLLDVRIKALADFITMNGLDKRPYPPPKTYTKFLPRDGLVHLFYEEDNTAVCRSWTLGGPWRHGPHETLVVTCLRCAAK